MATRLREGQDLRAKITPTIHQFLPNAAATNISTRIQAYQHHMDILIFILMRCGYLSISSAMRLVKCCYQNAVCHTHAYQVRKRVINLVYARAISIGGSNKPVSPHNLLNNTACFWLIIAGSTHIKPFWPVRFSNS